MTIDRFLAIQFPFLYDRVVTAKRTFYACLILTTYSMSISSLPLLGWNNYEDTNTKCYVTIILPKLYIQVILFGTMYLVLIVITTLYIIVFHTIQIQRKRIAHLSVGPDAREANQSLLSDVKIAVNLFIVVAAFVLCYIPYSIIILYILDTDPGNVHATLPVVGTTILLSNSALNPIIYAVRMKQFRKAFKAIICCDKDCHLDQQ